MFGALTFAVMREERRWPETAVMGFKLIAQVFTNALVRKQAETALRESEARLRVATERRGCRPVDPGHRHRPGLGFAQEPGTVSVCPG